MVSASRAQKNGTLSPPVAPDADDLEKAGLLSLSPSLNSSPNEHIQVEMDCNVEVLATWS
jgi:hypothetical protein